jgi:hypothetical protein
MVAVNENAARDDVGPVAIELLALGLRRHLAMQHGLNESLLSERRDNEVAIGDQSGHMSETPPNQA